MHTYRHLSLVFLLLVCTFSTLFAQGISMSPTRMFFSGSPGETISQPVILSNSSNTDYVFNINLKDWYRDGKGTKVYSDPGTLKNSNASWISTAETSINLPAKTDKEIMVTMKIPADASPTAVTNSMLFFTQIGKQKDIAEQQKGIGIIALFEFGLHVYFTPIDNNNRSLDIIGISELNNENTGMTQVEVQLENDGNLVNDATVELELTNTATGEEIKLDPINISMLPQAQQIVQFSLPEDLSGTYLGVTIVKMAGTNDLRVGEKTFEF